MSALLDAQLHTTCQSVCADNISSNAAFRHPSFLFRDGFKQCLVRQKFFKNPPQCTVFSKIVLPSVLSFAFFMLTSLFLLK